MAADPLESLRQHIQDASDLPSAEPYVPAADPLDRLKSLLAGQSAANDDPIVSAPQPAPAPGGGFEALLGREVLEMVRAQPLTAEAREEAVVRLTVALQNPTKDNLRAVLRVLISNTLD